VQTENLYGNAIEFAGLTGKERIFDAYCGTGTIGIIAAKGAKEAIGVEINKSAVDDAIINAKQNGIDNISFACADAGDYLNTAAKNGEKFDVILMDPPRAGATVKFLKSAVKASPNKIVYISCNPKTLARDLDFLTKNGYTVKEIQPVDMFPMTKHIETVVQLVRKKPDTYIDITVDMDELDLTSSEAKATYDEIKDYIFDKHFVKVSSLYIAQIKQKHGIIERDCYNNSKKESPKQPQCPPEKVTLIEEALRHFKMIP
jgi:23S rRNA (uracil1939-C5)-methyltransferase